MFTECMTKLFYTFPVKFTCRIAGQSPRINPPRRIHRILIQVIPTQQPNRILRGKAAYPRIVIAKRIVVKPGLCIEVLPLKAQVLLDALHLEPFHLAPGIVAGLPDQVALGTRHLQRSADLVGVEVVEAGFTRFGTIHPRQRFSLSYSNSWR